MRIWVRWIGFLLLTPVVCLLLAVLLLYIPAVQQVVAKKAMTSISESAGWEIGFERIQLSFPLNLTVRRLCIKETENDTLAFVNRMTVQVRLKPLLKGLLSVRKVNLESVELNTGRLLDNMVIQGKIGKIGLVADAINLKTERIDLNRVVFSNGDLTLFQCDTTSTAIPSSATDLIIGSKHVELKNITLNCRMPCDSIFLHMQVKKAVLSNGYIDLSAEHYGASGLSAHIDHLSYASDEQEAASGLDISHVQLTDVVLTSDSLFYDNTGTVYVLLNTCSAKERSGLVFQSMTGLITMNNTHIDIPSFEINTPQSSLYLQAMIPWSSVGLFSPEQDSKFNCLLNLHKEDVLLVLGNTSSAFQTHYPDTTLRIEANIDGNRSAISINKFEVELPGAFQLFASGAINAFDNERLRTGRIDYTLNTHALDFAASIVSLPQNIQIPNEMRLTGFVSVDKGRYTIETTGRESEGFVHLSGNYDIFAESYAIFLEMDSLEPVHFLPDDSILWISASIYAKGQGTDRYHPSTQAEIKGTINEIRYGRSSLSTVTFDGVLKENKLQVELKSGDPFIKGRICVDGVVQKDKWHGLLIVDVDSIDFYRLKLFDSPLSTSFQLISAFETDLEKKHALDITVGHWNLTLDGQTIQPKLLTLALHSDSVATQLSFQTGDMAILLKGQSDLEQITGQLMRLFKAAERHLKQDSVIDFLTLRSFYPELSLQVHADRDNTISHLLQNSNAFFDHFELNASLSPEEGLKMNGLLLALVKDTLRIDTVRLDVWQDTSGFLYESRIVKNRFRNQEPFKLNMRGYVRQNEADIFVSYLNSKGDKGLELGVYATKTTDGYLFSFYPERPVIAYIPFSIYPSNYFHIKKLNTWDANIRFNSDSGSSIWIHTGPKDEQATELMIEIDRLNLSELSNKLTFLPALKGLLNVSCRYIPVDQSFTVLCEGQIEDLYYEHSRVGDLLLNASWLPVGKGVHQVDFHAFHDMSEVGRLSGVYQEGKVDGFVTVNRFPFHLFNAMIPDQMVRMDGFLNGKINVTGAIDHPELNGELQMENVSAFIAPASTIVNFDNRTVKMVKNRLLLDRYAIFTKRENPLFIDGIVDVTNTSRPVVDLRMTGANLQLFDTRKLPENIVYGRLFANVNMTMSGPLQALRVRGNMRALGNSNFTYIMHDSPLDMEDNFSNLVTFTYFADTLPRRSDRPFNLMRGMRNRTVPTGMDVLLNINIDPVVRFRIDLDHAQSNYLEMRGGGDLTMQYTTQNDLKLNGRYTLSDGAIRYAIPVIPLTDFSIRNGSYVDWSGDPMNPYLNITAYTRVQSSVNLDGQSQMVDFNTGIQLRDNLDDVSVQFLLETPSNTLIQNQLTAMGAEERSKQAISLLVTGVFLLSKGAGSDNLDVGAALTSLLQREVKHILGNLLGDVPVSFDVYTYDGTKGMGRRIDYVGRFYKNFFNDRLNTSVGLRYSTKDQQYGNKFYPDDISIGYRLDMDGSRAIQVFRSREYENTFEGEIVKYGASFTLRRKVKNLKDLFVFKKPVQEEEKDENK